MPTDKLSHTIVLAIVDAGPLYAAADLTDAHHAASVSVFERRDLNFVIPALVITEVAYLVERRRGPRDEAAFLRALTRLGADVEAPTPSDLVRMAELVEQYANFPLGATDASVIALAERLGTDVIVTLDRRHFGAVRPRHCAAFRLLPE